MSFGLSNGVTVDPHGLCLCWLLVAATHTGILVVILTILYDDVVCVHVQQHMVCKSALYLTFSTA